MYPEDEIDHPQPQLTPEQFLADQKRSIRRKSWWAIGIGATIVVFHIAGFLLLITIQEELRGEIDEPLSWKLLFRSIFFILGVLATIGGSWGLYYARKLTLSDIIPSREAIIFLQEAQHVRPIYTYILIAAIVAVTFVQYSAGLEPSIEHAGFVKPAFTLGREYWRMLTGAVLHGGLLHIYFNSQALFGFGSLVEQLSNRAHLPIVFLIAAVGGGVLSLVFMPAGTSVGASGGIMGLIGYMAIFGYRRKNQLPPDFMKTMLINIGFIGAIGIIGYQFIDNFAHLGGLIAGGLYGLLQISSDQHHNPRAAGTAVFVIGVTALAAFIAVCVFAVIVITGNMPG